MNNCLFCKIIKGEIPSTKIYEDADFFAFLDINPVSIGHTLLIPKKHSRNLFDAEEETLAILSSTLKKLSIAIQKGTKSGGINIGINNETIAGQVVFHLHIHIIPRYKNDNIKMWEGKKENYKEEIADKIKKLL